MEAQKSRPDISREMGTQLQQRYQHWPNHTKINTMLFIFMEYPSNRVPLAGFMPRKLQVHPCINEHNIQRKIESPHQDCVVLVQSR